MPTPAFGGINAPAGLLVVIQFAVLKAGAAQTINSPMTASFTATMKVLTRADSRIPTTSNAVITTMIMTAGTFRMAPVDDHACCAASNENGDDTNRSGRTRPKSLTKLTTYPDQPMETAIAPTAYSRIRSQPMIQAISSPSVA